MRRLHGRSAGRPIRARRAGFTLVEILTATLLALVMMALVTSMFGQVAEAVNKNRASLEMRGQLRAVAHRLQKDLEGVTARTVPQLDPSENLGYLEIVEGPIGPIYWPCDPARNTFANAAPAVFDASNRPNPIFDTTLGDRDDVIMFTSRSRTEPFRGAGMRWNGSTYDVSQSYDSNEAEICWFLRGTTLYRRMLLVGSNDPQFPLTAHPVTAGPGFYRNWDVSVRHVGVTSGNGRFDDTTADSSGYIFVPNTLGDLTKRENRYAHLTPPLTGTLPAFPYDARWWGELGLPTLGESSFANWPLPALTATLPAPLAADTTPPGSIPLVQLTPSGTAFDPRANRFPFTELKQTNGQLALTAANVDLPRWGEDVVLTNVLKFDVKVWDPGAPIYFNATTNQAVLPGDPGYLTRYSSTSTAPADLPVGYGAWVNLNYSFLASSHSPQANAPPRDFAGPGNASSGLQGQSTAVSGPYAVPAVYDTGNIQYENDGRDQNSNGLIDEGSNGFDDNGAGGIDDAAEKEAPPPYSAPLRGVQITISVFEPDTQEIREVTIVQDFLR